MTTKLAKVDGKTVLLGCNDNCIVPLKRQKVLNNLAKRRISIPTQAEKRMIFHIRTLSRMLNDSLRYRREMPIHFSSNIARIVDIAFPRQKLILEIDGKIHEDPLRKSSDEWKDVLAKQCGWDTIRITNEIILGDIDLAMKLFVCKLCRCRLRLPFIQVNSLFSIKEKLEEGISWSYLVGEFFTYQKNSRL